MRNCGTDPRTDQVFSGAARQIIALDHAWVRLARTIDWSFPGAVLRRGLHRRRRSPAAADAADGGARHPQAHARPVRRGAVRAWNGQPPDACGIYSQRRLGGDSSSIERPAQSNFEALVRALRWLSSMPAEAAS